MYALKVTHWHLFVVQGCRLNYVSRYVETQESDRLENAIWTSSFMPVRVPCHARVYSYRITDVSSRFVCSSEIPLVCEVVDVQIQTPCIFRITEHGVPNRKVWYVINIRNVAERLAHVVQSGAHAKSSYTRDRKIIG